MKRKRAIILLGILLVVSTTQILPLVGISSSEDAYPSVDPLLQATPVRDTETAAHTLLEGILDPVSVERRGYASSGVQYARTDISPSVEYDLPLDDAHDWVGSRAEVNVSDLKRLYAVNGTFENGIPGQDILNDTDPIDHYPYAWNATGFNPSGAAQLQVSGYDSSGAKFVFLENQGVKIGPSGTQYNHMAGTEAVWYQLLDNRPYTENFYLSFSYYYLRGPLGSGVTGEGRIFAKINDTIIWNTSIPDLPSRGTWYTVNNWPVTILGAGPVLNFSIGFAVDETFVLKSAEDNDGDGYEDGIANTVYITAWFDDISFVGQSAPDFEAVDMQFSAGATTTPISGSLGVGSAVITNETNWDVDPVPTLISSNTSVSFDYETKLLSHKYTDSNYDTNPLELGVNYLVSPDNSPELSFYTYLGSLGTYQDFALIVEYPNDWENVTVLEPQSSDVTSQCIVSQGMLIIPTSLLLESFGWWYSEPDSPNYASSLSLQVYDSGGDQWNTETVFRSGNQSRASILIGSGENIPDPLNLVNTTWIMPNGTIWYDESVSGGVAGQIYGSVLTLGATNTTAGEWYVLMSWRNGTEVAYGEAVFEVHHSTVLYAANPVVQTEAGLTATVFVVYKDAENNDFLMENTASLTANWSTSTITFDPNDNRNQWEADFDTALFGPGEYLVVVNASQTYYDDVSCTFIIQSVGVDNDLLVYASFVTMNLQATYTAEVRFVDRYGGAITGADISVTIAPAVGLSWVDVDFQDLGNGNYTFGLLAVASGTYSVEVLANASSYEAAKVTFIVDVGEFASNLEIDGPSVATVEFGDSYLLTLRYTNGTGFGLADANVSVVNPPLGLTLGDVQDVGDGYYTILLTPDESSNFVVLIEASLLNHETKYVQFNLVTISISSQLTYTATSSTISIDQNCTVYLNFTSSSFGGIEGGTLGLVGSYPGLTFGEIQEIGGGIYSVEIEPSDIGTYYIVFYASAENHVDATAFFPLTVIPVQTELHAVGGISSASVGYSGVYQLQVFFERESPSANITGATVEVYFDSLETLEWDVAILGEGYLISFEAGVLGRWSITITANLTGYDPASMRFVLFVEEIATQLSTTSPLEALHYGRSYEFVYEYKQVTGGTGITGATISAIGVGASWLEFTDLGNGRYRIEVIPERIGSFSVDISLQEYGFQERSAELVFEVVEVPLHIEADSFVWNQNQPLTISITLLDDLDEPVSGAEVTYHLLYRDEDVSWGAMEMSSAGVYSVTIQPVWYGDGGYEVRISVSLENHLLTTAFTESIIEIQSNEGIIMQFLQQYGLPSGVAIGFFAFAFIGYRSYAEKRRREYLEALAVKKRFDDVDNLLGIIILHGSSGLPIYSNVLKGGFEEGMISAFITAITLFRQEFVTTEKDDLTYEVIPISDIIRAVPTRNLVCAFITISKASMQQEDRMVAFAKEIGALFDDMLEDRPKEFRDETMALTIQYAFENTLDGFLLKYYKRATASRFPRNLAPLEGALTGSDLSECASARALASSMVDEGIDEARGSAIVLKAIETGVIMPCDKHEIHMHRELDWQLFEDIDGI